MTEMILITGEAASGKSLLAAHIATQMGAATFEYDGEDEIGFTRRFAVARQGAGPRKLWGSAKIADDFPHAKAYAGIDVNDTKAMATFLDAMALSEFRAFILVAHLIREDTSPRGAYFLTAKFDTVLNISRVDGGLRRVNCAKEKQPTNRWAGLYRIGIDGASGQAVPFLFNPRDEEDGA